MTISAFTFNPFSTNCFVVESGGKCAIVDPGCQSEREFERLTSFIASSGYTVETLLLTHAHIDHIFGCKPISELYGLPFYLHDADWPLFKHASQQASMFGFELDIAGVEILPVNHGDKIKFGQLTLDVLHTPGHSPGSVSFVDHESKSVISGDVLFWGSIGRTDLWGGSMEILMDSIRNELVPLGPEYKIYPGHGEETEIGRESASNPFLQ